MTTAMNGSLIKCARCNGSGIGQKASAYQPWDEECCDCGGSGKNWQYSGGAIAKHYSGQLIGRVRSPKPSNTN
ncbi:MAG: hypothetical protein EOS51_33005 [Mesorhizobium sp.]|uniref:hypothetical protein n=1 Tax=Mesorhizobium sp. TaxID=1871066 RepID=UPI000FE6D8A1|nr:hypothetical protein [Mesorhizobium sp.]RWB94494.1 MAG: hypothetical protein EOS51_33005 [Mesorhizobium sp.]